ncbi:unnamed protein product, partial [Brassica oleracea]
GGSSRQQIYLADSFWAFWGKGMGRRQISQDEVGPPINPRAGLRREQAGRGSYRGS